MRMSQSIARRHRFVRVAMIVILAVAAGAVAAAAAQAALIPITLHEGRGIIVRATKQVAREVGAFDWWVYDCYSRGPYRVRCDRQFELRTGTVCTQSVIASADRRWAYTSASRPRCG